MDAHGKKIRKKRIVFKIGMSGKKKKMSGKMNSKKKYD